MQKFSKALVGAVVAMMLLAVVTGAALAAGPHNSDRDGDGVRDLVNEGESLGYGMAQGFVDEDGDGVNDRYLSEPQFVDEDGDGVCDLIDSQFVDEDGDGLCDLHDGTQSLAENRNFARGGRYSHSGSTEVYGNQTGTCIAQ